MNKRHYFATVGVHVDAVIPSLKDVEPPNTMPNKGPDEGLPAEKHLSKSMRKKVLLAFRERFATGLVPCQ